LDVDFTFSPVSDDLVFARNQDGQGSLWLSGQGPQECLFGVEGMQVFNPVWSPNGAMIAFAVVESEPSGLGYQHGTLHVVVPGSQAYDTGLWVTVNREEPLGEIIRWADDSRYILVSPYRIAVWDTAAHTATVIEDGSARPQMASFSPSGRGVAYTQWEEDNRQLVKVHWLDSGEKVVIKETPTTLYSEAYFPAPCWVDEKTLVVLLPGAEAYELALVGIGSGSHEKIAYPAGRATVSPDRHWLAFVEAKDDGLGYVLYDLVSNQRAWTFDEMGTAELKWSPDSSKLVAWGRGMALVADCASRRVHPLTVAVPDQSYLGYRASWSRDSSQVIMDVGDSFQRSMTTPIQ
jgi:Tol biopolymer transport system component